MQKVPAHLHADGARIRVEGALTFHTVTAVLEDSRAMFGKGDDPVVFDLGKVKETDSAALALLLEWLRWSKKQNRGVTFENVPPRLMQLARISELDGLIVPGPA